MGHLLRELNGVLLKQIRLYDQFIALLKKQWTCTTDYSLDPLLKINAEKEIMADDIQRLEKKRSLLMLSIERQMGLAPGLTLKKLIQSQKDPINASLIKSRKKLLEQITQVNQLHERIRKLTDFSSLSIKKSMAFIHSTGDQAVSPYKSNGQVGEGKILSRMLSVDA
jgi:hypothetical protein